MPSKHEKTTRKGGTVTRIKLYADEVRAIERVRDVFDELSGMVSSPDDIAELGRVGHGLDVGLKYENYIRNSHEKENKDVSSDAKNQGIDNPR